MKLLVINCAALSAKLATRSDLAKNTSFLIEKGGFLPLYPVFPALTIPAQASLTTGTYPDEHGMIANGLFEKESFEYHFWHQPNQLLYTERFWTKIKKSGKLKVAMLFWQNSKYSDTDIVNTPAPIHTEVGEVISTCYSKPDDLYDNLVKTIGEFPLHRYWSPMANHESSQWIVNCTKFVLENSSPDLTFTYLPHLDYSTQRFGPDAKQVLDDFAILDEMIGTLTKAAKDAGCEVVVLSEYGMSPVNGAIHINRKFRKMGLLAARNIRGKEYLELGDCKAFALVDHQIAHVYLNGADSSEVKKSVKEINPSIEVLETEVEKDKYRINHERSGDLILISPPDKWFSYYWWLDDDKAPTFTRTIDIHRKPGYDPLDLFFDPKTKGISMDTNLIRGSHGRLPTNRDEMGVFISSQPVPKADKINATDVASYLEKLLLA